MVYKNIIIVMMLLFIVSCAPAVRKTVRPDGARNNDVSASANSKGHHVVQDVVAATEASPQDGAGTFQWQTKETNTGGLFVDIPFEYNSFTISEKGAVILKNISLHLQKKGELKLVIEGHCDERGSDEYNLALGEKRAEAVKEYLSGLGVDKIRLSSISFGEERPKNSAGTDGAMAENRRVQFEVVK
ncbi:MAG: OmpA family protein [Fibrobacteres bacterium]|nr:OmpA family protein [Fibrobacterota bacterium]